ncbi:MAG: Fur family transcriptional regulator [Solirubrobacteraceae bacterium]
MTVSPDSPRLRFDTLAEAISALRERGLRLSTARRLILEALFAAKGPVSAVHLARILSIEESSVYRNLEVLEGHGLLRHVHLGHGPGLYVLLGDDEVEYLYCHRCAKVTAVAPDRLDAVRQEIKRGFGYETSFAHFAIVGLCAACAAAARPSSVAQTGSGKPIDEQTQHSHPPGPGADEANADQLTHEHAHSHGDFVHSHPTEHAGEFAHQH